MPQYLVAIHHPDGYDGSKEGPEMMRDIIALNKEMVAAGVRVFVGGLLACVREPAGRDQGPQGPEGEPGVGTQGDGRVPGAG